MTVARKVLFSAVACAALFLGAELVLWLAGTETLSEREDPSRGFSGLVDAFVREGDVYRTRESARTSTFNDQSFLAEKPANGLRLFCLGGSSSYGFPWGAGVAFPAVLGDVLGEVHPERTVEAVNASGVSYAMHRLYLVAREILNYEPDILLVYSGHNEFVEPAFFHELKRRSPGRDRIERTLARTRVYSALHSLLAPEPQGPEAGAERFDMIVRREQNLVFGADQKREIAAEFESRLRDLVRLAQGRGIRVVLATVPANLRDWPPWKSMLGDRVDPTAGEQCLDAVRDGRRLLEAGRYGEAAAVLRRAAELAPSYAEAHYLLGQAGEGLEDWDQARQAYDRACDTDASPIRRVSAINDATRAVAAEEGALLVDMDRIFAEQSPHGLVGFNLVEDYVHPTVEGHRLIALYLWHAIEEQGWLGGEVEAGEPLFREIVSRRAGAAAPANAAWFYNQGCILQHQGQLDRAMERYRQALELAPKHQGAHNNLGILLRDDGQLEAAVRHFEANVALDPDNADWRGMLAKTLQVKGQVDAALEHFEAALALHPESAPMHRDLGIALAALERFPEAVEHFRTALELDADDAAAHYGLANILVNRGELDAARIHYEHAVRIDPDDVGAHNNLGIMCARQGDLTQARRHFERVLEIDSDDVQARQNLAEVRRRLSRGQGR